MSSIVITTTFESVYIDQQVPPLLTMFTLATECSTRWYYDATNNYLRSLQLPYLVENMTLDKFFFEECLPYSQTSNTFSPAVCRTGVPVHGFVEFGQGNARTWHAKCCPRYSSRSLVDIADILKRNVLCRRILHEQDPDALYRPHGSYSIRQHFFRIHN